MALAKLDAPTALVLIDLWVRREKKGAEWCKKRIGPIRAYARELPPVPYIAGNRPTADIFMDVRHILALQCKACGACELSRDEP